jgi:hypothetical protein
MHQELDLSRPDIEQLNRAERDAGADNRGVRLARFDFAGAKKTGRLWIQLLEQRGCGTSVAQLAGQPDADPYGHARETIGLVAHSERGGQRRRHLLATPTWIGT